MRAIFISLFLISSLCGFSRKIRIPALQNYLDAKKETIKPGDTLLLEAGKKPYLQLKNIRGNETSPVIILNEGEVIIENADFYYGIKLVNCQYFIFSGTGDSDFVYGIRIAGTGSNANGLSIDGISSDFTIDHIEIGHAGFAGIMSKADPLCDGSQNRGSFLQKNISIHDNYIHDVNGEGLYIGNSFYEGYSRNKNCYGKVLYPHEIKNINIFNNLIENTGWDGLQVGCATLNCNVFNNRISNFGQEGTDAQNNGLQIGEGSSGYYYNNVIMNGSGNGIIILGKGTILIYNNYIETVKGAGIFCDDRSEQGNETISVINNSVIDYGKAAFKWYNDRSKAIFINNLAVGNNPDFHFSNEVQNKELKNNMRESTTYGLNKAQNGSLVPRPGSACYKKAIPVSIPLKIANPHIGAYITD